MIFSTVRIMLLAISLSPCNAEMVVPSRSRRFAANPLDTLRSYARDRLSGSRLFMLYDRINGLRTRRSVPHSGPNRRYGSDVPRNTTEGREIEADVAKLLNNNATTFKTTSTTSINGERGNQNRSPNAAQFSSTTQRPWNPQGLPPPPSGPARPVQPTLNVIPTVQVGVVPTGNRTSFFVGYYRPTFFGPPRGGSGGGRLGGLLPRITTSFSTYYPQNSGYYYPWYNYGASFNFPFYNSFQGYPQYHQQYPLPPPQTYPRPQQVPVASAPPQGRTASGGQQQQRGGEGNRYAVLYRPQPGDAGTVQYSYVPVDEVVGGLRRTASQIFGFLSRRFGGRPGAYIECPDCDQPGQVLQALQDGTPGGEGRTRAANNVRQRDKNDSQEQSRAPRHPKDRKEK